MSDVKQTLLEQWRQGRTDSVSDTIPVRSHDGPAPLSYAQERLWFLDQLVPGDALYTIAVALRVHGALDQAALHRSFATIVARHSSLRTTFHSVGGTPQQRIAPPLPVVLPMLDLSAWSADPEPLLTTLLTTLAQHPFDLQRGPLWRCYLLRLQPTETIICLTLHHIVADGWSIGVLLREWVTLYRATTAHTASTLPPLPIQYADYAVWQRTALQGAQLAQHLTYWRTQLQELTPTTLPTDHPRPTLQRFRGATVPLSFPVDLLTALQTLSHQHQATLFMVLLATFKVLVYRYTGQTDLSIGTPIANRTRPELEALIGFFVNTLVLRTTVHRTTSFLTLVQQVRQVALAAYAHQDLPFEQLVAELQPVRDLSRTPLFQLMFGLQNARTVALGGTTWPGTDQPLAFVPIARGSAKFDLEVYLEEWPTGLYGYLEYARDLFEETTLTRLVGHWQVLLEGIVADPTQALGTLPLLSATERAMLCTTWAGAGRPRRAWGGLLAQVATQVQQGPDRIAVVDGTQQVSYAVLAGRAAAVGAYLQQVGVTVEHRVGVYLERSGDMVLAIWGILLAGGAYVPVDPRYPTDRVRVVLQDAQVTVVLTEAALQAQLPATGAVVQCVEAIPWSERGTPMLRAFPAPHPEQLAYIIYTSGSTGTPKGVAVTHRGIIRLVTRPTFVHMGSDEIVLQAAPISFDASTFEIWGGLAHGARLVLSSSTTPSLHELSQTIQQHHITTLWLTAGLFHHMVDHALHGLQGVRQLLAGGDVLSVPHLDKVRSTYPDCRIINGYGPTENTTFTCCYTIPYEGSLGERVPIGVPIDGTQIYLLNQDLHLMPIGIPAELYVSGDGLARGYLGQPVLTAQSLLPHPWGAIPGQRVYKTGDRVRYRSHGVVDFLGRLDQQLKINGFRIEPGEIEALLHDHPLVEQAVVLANVEQTDGKQLVAYITQPVDLHYEGQAVEIGKDLLDQQVVQWRALYDNLYGQTATTTDPTFDIRGWVDSYTNEPIPEQDMEEWTESTIQRIIQCQPRRILEIGCGTGILLYRLAVQCEQYLGTDFSYPVLEQVRQQIAYRQIQNVTLLHQEAIQFDYIKPGYYDTILLNSVVQYFPSLTYLTQVITQAVDHLADKGTLFIGDIRNSMLLEAFHASVELARAADALEPGHIYQRMQERVLEETELLVAPHFFVALQERLPRIRSVEILPKRGYATNELTKYRYDVIFHIGVEDVHQRINIPWLHWHEQGLHMARVHQLLLETEPLAVGITDVPNARIFHDVHIMEMLSQGTFGTVGDLRTALYRRTNRGVHPEEWWTLCEALPYHVAISWARCDRNGHVDVVLRRQIPGEVMLPDYMVQWPHSDEPSRQAARDYANHPIAPMLFRTLIPELRHYLQNQLPDYMIPHRFVRLDRLPIGPNGKVDRHKLAAMRFGRGDLPIPYVAPRSSVEEIMTDIWLQVLGLDDIGVNDNFFELGGHSLLATQIVSRMQDVFDVAISLRTFLTMPTIAAQSEMIVAQLGQDDVANGVPPLEPQDYRFKVIPLSYAQERLWFLDQLVPGDALYTIAVALRVHGALDQAALHRSFATIVARHSSLRTTFHSVGGTPQQRIAPPLPVVLPMLDLSAWSADPEPLLTTLLTTLAQHPFDLQRGPLWRCYLLRLQPTETIICLTLHHIVADGWSIGVLLREWVTLYRATTAHTASTLPPLPIQYADYAVWQRTALQGAQLAQHLTYWRTQLQELTPTTLPTDHPRPTLQRFRGATVPLSFPVDLLTALQTLSHQHQATLFMVLLATFKVLVYRYTGQTDLSIGTPIANRTRPELEALIGFFVNTLVLRTTVHRTTSFLTLVQQVRQVALAAYAHQDLPFEQLVAELQPVRDLSRTPLFQLMFGLQNARTVALGGTTWPGTDQPLAFVPIARGSAKFDLEVYLEEWPTGLYGYLEYARDLFEETTLTRLVGHWQVLLEGIVADPTQALGTLPLLSATERAMLCTTWAGAGRPRRAWGGLLAQVATQVQQGPDRIAVVDGTQQVSYAVLAGRAAAVGAYLQQVGVTVEHRVGVYLERSGDMVLAIWGILLAGGAYVPVDPRYPTDRVRVVLQDAQVTVVLTEAALQAQLPATGAVVQCVEAIPWSERGTPMLRAFPAPHPEQLAYIIYTSGSTGTPKGVAVSHNNVARLFQETYPWFDFDPTDVWTFFHSFAFDFSVWEIWGALLYGGKLVVVPYIVTRSPEECHQLMVDEQVTVLNQTPSAFAQLNHIDATCSTPAKLSLRWIIFGGEALDMRPLQDWVQRHGNTTPQLVNMYGITETTVHVTAHVMNMHASQQTVGSLIGTPMPDLQVCIMDSYLRPIPHGIPGELCVGGAGVARGYLHRPALTAATFIPHPFSAVPGARLYRSGDIARYTAQGVLEYYGRRDQQVKIRGHRIELGEIQTLLHQHPLIREALVSTVQDHTQTDHIVAYIIPTNTPKAFLAHQQRYRLPNGLDIVHCHKYETDFLYQEIFEQEIYTHHQIRLAADDCVFDVGANIGLFTLFAHQRWPGIRTYAFEPFPPLCELLHANVAQHQLDTQIFEFGLSDRTKTVNATFYPHSSVMSGVYTDVEADKAITKQYMHNREARMDIHAEELLSDRFVSETYPCQFVSLSDVIHQHAIERIDLLKIDVEKSELDVIAGIAATDWEKIKRLVIEVHDIDGRLAYLSQLLEQHGYDVIVEQDRWLQQTNLYTLYAHRPAPHAEVGQYDTPTQTAQRAQQPSLTAHDIRSYLKPQLPDYMLPASLVFLDTFPLTPHGKIDRRALVAAYHRTMTDDRDVTPLQPGIEEKLGHIWCRLLHTATIGRHDNFFDVGGHSLLLPQLLSDIRDYFEVSLRVTNLFEFPTIARLAAHIEHLQIPQPSAQSLANQTTHTTGLTKVREGKRRLQQQARRRASTPVRSNDTLKGD